MPPNSAPSPVPESNLARWFADEVQPHEPALRSYLQARFPAMRDIDDIVQDSYVQILTRQPAGKIASARAYLFTIAHHAVLRVFRRQRLFSSTPVSELPPSRLVDEKADAAEFAQTRQQESLVAEAIAALPSRCGEIFSLRVARGISHAEIAAQLGLSEATVRVQVARGLRKCAEFVRQREASTRR